MQLRWYWFEKPDEDVWRRVEGFWLLGVRLSWTFGRSSFTRRVYIGLMTALCFLSVNQCRVVFRLPLLWVWTIPSWDLK